jgi:hypothetical protein
MNPGMRAWRYGVAAVAVVVVVVVVMQLVVRAYTVTS